MGLIARISTAIKATVNDLLDRAEDPRVTMDYAYERQLEHLQGVKRGIVEVATARRRLEMQGAQLRENAGKLDDQARRAVAAGRDDLARIALQRKQEALEQLQALDQQIAALRNQEEKLSLVEQRLTAKVEAFRTQKEVIKAQYSAAEAHVKIGESLTGISEEMNDVGMAVQRARDKTADVQARAGAIEELVAAGTLEDLTGDNDRVESELSRMTISQNVERELAAIKQQTNLPGVDKPGALEEG